MFAVRVALETPVVLVPVILAQRSGVQAQVEGVLVPAGSHDVEARPRQARRREPGRPAACSGAGQPVEHRIVPAPGDGGERPGQAPVPRSPGIAEIGKAAQRRGHLWIEVVGAFHRAIQLGRDVALHELRRFHDPIDCAPAGAVVSGTQFLGD